MKRLKKIVFFDFLGILISILIFKDKSFPFIGIGIIILGIGLFKYYNQKPN